MERVTGPEQARHLVGRFPRTMAVRGESNVRHPLDATVFPTKPEDPRDD